MAVVIVVVVVVVFLLVSIEAMPRFVICTPSSLKKSVEKSTPVFMKDVCTSSNGVFSGVVISPSAFASAVNSVSGGKNATVWFYLSERGQSIQTVFRHVDKMATDFGNATVIACMHQGEDDDGPPAMDVGKLRSTFRVLTSRIKAPMSVLALGSGARALRRFDELKASPGRFHHLVLAAPELEADFFSKKAGDAVSKGFRAIYLFYDPSDR
jgi:hypothetical protein